MKAIVFPKPGEVIYTDRDIPKLEAGESLIKVKYVGICGTDLHVLNGHHATATYPLIPGHEFVGELVEVKGEGAERYTPGDIVVAQEVLSCGVCEACAKGEDNVCTRLKIIGVHTDGGFAEYVKVKTRKMYVLPKNTDLQVAALTEPLAVAIHDVRLSELKAGETAFVAGGGPIGLLIALVARMSGARKVVISEVNIARRRFAESLEFDTVDPANPDFNRQVEKLHEGRLFDVCFDCAGAKGVLNICVQLAKPTGTVMMIAISNEPTPIDNFMVFSKELRLQGVRIHSLYSFLGAVDIIKSGRMNEELRPLISRVFPLGEATEALNYAQHSKDSFKVLIQVSE